MSADASDKPTGGAAHGFAEIALDRDAEVPIGVQLAWALRSRIGEGQLAPEQRLPALRDMAEAVGVNVNTVRAVYQRLELEGLIVSHQGSGTFVTAMAQRSSAVGAIAASAAREALETGVDPRAVAAALYVSGEPPGSAEGPAARRRLLRTQIAALERALGEIEAAHPGVAPAPEGVRSGIGPALLSAEELEQVRTLLVRRLATVQVAIDAQPSGEAPRAALSREARPARPARAAKPAREPKPVRETAAEPGATPAPRRPAKPRASSRPAPAGT